MARKPKAPGKKGRPSVYTAAIAAQICELLKEGKTLTSICKDVALPHESTVRSWAIDLEHPFYPHYARAREIGYHKMADDIFSHADASATDAGTVARDRLKVETRKWFLSKALPKIYGDKVAITDADGGTFKVQFVR